MGSVRNFIIGVSLLLGTSAHAQFLTEESQDLADYMTPAELEEEVGVEYAPTLWNASVTNPRLVIVIDRAERGTSATAQTVEVYLDDQQIHRFKTSTGKEAWVTTPSGQKYFATTPIGEFRIGYRSRYHKSKKWNGADMPFAQFFNGGIAVHATTESHFNHLGRRDSGGCARLHPENAETMWNLVGNIGTQETKVIVFDGAFQKHPVDQFLRDRYVVPQEIVPLPQARPTQPRETAPVIVPQKDSGYPKQWMPSPNPTPPPRAPRGERDTYPYCTQGFWCPYQTS